MSYDPNTPINRSDIPLVDSIVVPDNIDRVDIAFPINVINSIDKRVLGQAMFYRGQITSFSRNNGDFKVRPRLDLSLPSTEFAPRVSIGIKGGVFSETLVVDGNIVSGEYTFDFSDDTVVRWRVRIIQNSAVLFERNIPAGTLRNQVLFEDLEWWGDITIEAWMGDTYGKLVQNYPNPYHLSKRIPQATLDGLGYPSWVLSA